MLSLTCPAGQWRWQVQHVLPPPVCRKQGLPMELAECIACSLVQRCWTPSRRARRAFLLRRGPWAAPRSPPAPASPARSTACSRRPSAHHRHRDDAVRCCLKNRSFTAKTLRFAVVRKGLFTLARHPLGCLCSPQLTVPHAQAKNSLQGVLVTDVQSMCGETPTCRRGRARGQGSEYALPQKGMMYL